MEAPARLISFIALLPLHLLLSCSLCGGAVLQDTCRSVARAHPRIGYDFCVAMLQGDPEGGAGNADRRGLAVIATRLSLAHASAAESAIANLTRSESDPSLRGCLGVCSEVYGLAVDHLGRAMRSLGSRQYREAVALLSAAVDAPDNCDDAFVEAGGGAAPPPALVGEDGVYGRVTAVALTIAASLR